MASAHGWKPADWIRLVTILAIVSLTSLYSFLLFHSLVELSGVVVAGSIFVIGWSTRPFLEDDFLPSLGIGYLCVAVLDTFHTLAYSGMGFLPVVGSDAATQFWIAARFLEALTLLLAPFLMGRKVRLAPLFFAAGVVTSLLIGSILLWGIFPTCYLEGVGLTPFKVWAESAIILMLLVAGISLFKRRNQIAAHLFGALGLAILFTAAAEFSFTRYVYVFGPTNMVGHLFKFTSILLVYEGLIRAALRSPYEVLFRNLQKSEEEMRLLAHRIQSTMEQERKRFATDLHDELGAVLTGLQMDAKALRGEEAREGTRHGEALAQIVKTAGEAAQYVRDYSAAIHSPVLELLGPGPAIQEFVETLVYPHQPRFQLQVAEGSLGVGHDVQVSLLRIAQEAITNAVLYSEADTVSITLRREENTILLEVADDGIGIPREKLEAETSFGLLGMRERARAMGGDFQITSPVEGGTVVRFSLCLPSRDGEGS